MKYWTDFGLRQMPALSARRRADFPPAMQALIEERTKPLREPFLGLTTGGPPGRVCFRCGRPV
jgi:hypothetical protein